MATDDVIRQRSLSVARNLADAPTTRAFGGPGLGLAIVRQLVEVHGGTMRVDSEGGRSRVEFRRGHEELESR